MYVCVCVLYYIINISSSIVIIIDNNHRYEYIQNIQNIAFAHIMTCSVLMLRSRWRGKNVLLFVTQGGKKTRQLASNFTFDITICRVPEARG